MGSSTVAFDGDPASLLGLPVLSCHCVGMPSPPRKKPHTKPKSLELPTTVVMAVPKGPPVLIGGPPTISLMAMAMKFGMAVLGRALKKLRKMQKASKKWKGLSDKMRKASNKILDKVPGGQKMKNAVSNGICKLTGHPVDVATGKVTTESTDIELPGPLPFKFSRVWYSNSDYVGPLGHGWHHSYDLGLYEFPEGLVVRLPDGRFATFEPPTFGDAEFNRTERLFLRRTADAYEVETLDGLIYSFSAVGRAVPDNSAKRAVGQSPTYRNPDGEEGVERPLREVRDPNGNRIELVRENGKLTAFIDSGGRRLPVVTDKSGRIIAIHGPDPENPGQTFALVAFAYSKEGDLVEVGDALGHPFRYAYGNHLLLKETDRAGLSFYFMYDADGTDAKCLRTWGDGDLFLRDLTYDTVNRRTTEINSLGHKRVYEWNDAGLVTAEIDPLGGVTKTEWGLFNEKLSETNPNGEKTSFEYDDFGRLVSVVNPTGAAVKYEYDESGNPVTYTDAAGHVWMREYDSRRNVAAVINPLGNRWQFGVDHRGLPIKAIDPAGNQASFTWTVAGIMASYTDRAGARTDFTYDELGRPVERTDADNRKTSFRHDKRGLLAGLTDPSGRRSTIRHTAAGQISERIDGFGRVTRYSHGPMGRVTSVQTPAGRETKYSFDTEGRLNAIEPSGMSAWRYIRDENGRVVEESTSDGRKLRWRYDGAGRATEAVNGRGQKIVMRRDSAGRVVERVLWDGATETFGFDARGLLTRAKNRAAAVVREYDPCGRLVVETVNCRKVSRSYDSAGRRVGRVSPFGRALRLDYDPEGRMVGASVDSRLLFRSVLDKFGRENRRETPEGASWEWDFRADGMRTGVRVRGRDRVDRAYSFNERGEPTGQTDDLFGTTKYDHDQDGYLTKVQWQSGGEEFAYDRVGNIQTPSGFQLRRDADGNVVEKRGPNGTWRFEYDPFGRLARANSDGGADVKFEYDPLGRRVRKSSTSGTIDYLWDGDTPLGEDGPETVEYLFRPGNFEAVAQFGDEGAMLVECDPVGLPRSAASPEGKVVWRADFEPFGRVREEVGRPNLVRLRYPGQTADPETGLLYNWFRYLDPDLHAYTTPDPIGYTERATPWNYTRSPVRAIDPYGLIDPWDIMFSQDTIDPVFRDGPWAGRTLDEAIAEARDLNRLPDGLEINAMVINDEWVTLNNRTLFVAQQANLSQVPVNDVGPSGINQFNKLQRDAGLSGPVESVTVRPCK
jgi:RHS repeat-associated protein